MSQLLVKIHKFLILNLLVFRQQLNHQAPPKLTVNKKIPKWLMVGLIILLFGATSIFAYKYYQSKQQVVEKPGTMPGRVVFITEDQQLIQKSAAIQKSNWSYDLQNPDRDKFKHVSAVPRNITEKYLPIWKKLFMEKNAISENYFNEHIQVMETGKSTDQSRSLSKEGERGREYFEVLYRIKIDWIEFCQSDHLLIRKKDQTEYLSIEEFIDEEESTERKFQKVGSFIPIEDAPLSFEDAVQKLKQINSDAKYLKPVYLTLRFSSPSADTEQIANGGILLYGKGTIDFEANHCAEGYFNLVTGKGSTMRPPCWVE